MNNLTKAEQIILETSIKDLMQYNLFKHDVPTKMDDREVFEKYYFDFIHIGLDFIHIGFQTKAAAREYLSEQKKLLKESLKSVEADVYLKPFNIDFIDGKSRVYMKGFWAAQDGSCKGEYVEAVSVREFWANLKKTFTKNIKINYKYFLFQYWNAEREFLKNFFRRK